MSRKHFRWVGRFLLVGCAAGLTTLAFGAAKPHVVGFGKWSSVQVMGGDAEEKTMTVKVRPLVVDTRVKEFTLGPAHDITERLFAVRRAFRVNDSLPQENATAPHWQWERGGWLLVDRVSGKVSAINLPEFDGDYSNVNWYRDYAAYCGVSDDGKHGYAMVVQVSRRKPLLKQLMEGKPKVDSSPQSEPAGLDCSVRMWERGPVRVTFEMPGSSRITFAVRGHVADLVSEEEEREEAAK